jgi:hypothetical protein
MIGGEAAGVQETHAPIVSATRSREEGWPPGGELATRRTAGQSTTWQSDEQMLATRPIRLSSAHLVLVPVLVEARPSAAKAVAGKAPDRMYLVAQDTDLHGRILVHEASCFPSARVEDVGPGQVAVVGDRADDGQHPVGPQRELAPPVFPDDRIGTGLVISGRGL